jgi:signal transduction histidine kinase
MRRWVLAIAGTHVALSVVLLALVGSRSIGGSAAALVGCVAAFALVGMAPMHLELRRHACTVVVTEAVLVVALLLLGPVGVVLAATLGEAMACLGQRQPRLKLVFNVAAAAGASAVAAALYSVVSTPGGWAPVAAAVAAFAVASLATTSAILAVAERRRFFDVMLASAPTVAVSSAASASLGLSAVVLAEASVFGPVLLGPLLAMVFAGTRRMAVQSADHLRFQRLYDASSRTSRLVGFDDSLATLAAEARGLVTGSASVCIARRPDGSWAGAVVDDAGVQPAPVTLVEALVSLESSSVEEWPRALRAAMPSAADMVWAPPRLDGRAPVGLAVFREIGPDDQAATRAEVLRAFAGHAVLTVSNALLYEEVEAALHHQIDLTRQKGDFLATVSHELRTPLTCVLGAVSTLRRCRDRLDEFDVERLLGTAIEQGDRLKRLIEDLLQVASAEHGDMAPEHRPIDVAALVGSVAGDLSGTSGHRLSAHVDPGCVGLRSDPHRVRQILSNLVENAIKYAPSGPIEVMARPAPAAVDMFIVDHGPGIPDEDRERVFERFVQLDQSSTRRQGGTGLGLYLCRQLASMLDGTLTLEETPGGGCTFRLRLPVLPVTAGMETIQAAPVGVLS